MKKTLFTVSFVLSILFCQAQYYYIPFINAGENPNNLNQDVESVPHFNGQPAALDSNWLLLMDGIPDSLPIWTSQQQIPFPFQFNAQPVSSYFVSNSGVLTFSQTPGVTPGFANLELPNSTIPDKSICVLGVKGIGPQDFVLSKTFGVAPNHQHWIFFSSVHFVGGHDFYSYIYCSIVLEETTNNIYFVDQRHGNGTPALSVGIQIDANSAISIAGSPNLAMNSTDASVTTDNSYYKFVPSQVGSEELFGDIEAYPNPASSHIVIGNKLCVNSEIALVNSNGQLIYNSKIKSEVNRKVIDVSSLPKGIYFLRIIKDNITRTRKVVIK